jgi:hypothetical protein
MLRAAVFRNTVFCSNIVVDRQRRIMLWQPRNIIVIVIIRRHSAGEARRGEDVTGAAPSITAPRNNRRY